MPFQRGVPIATMLARCLLFPLLAPSLSSGSPVWQALRPYPENPYYWEYEGEPTLFFGASDSDNIFQFGKSELIDQLDRLVAAGGNQLRNTMSSRDPGDLQPFLRLASGQYDLDQWNPVYWEKLDLLLRESQAREILVQIELWDRFDVHDEPWLQSAYNPANNINYSSASSGLATEYPEPGWSESNPFLYTVPGLDNNPVVLAYQEAFVAKVVETAAPYGNVLFCVSNETRLPEEWSRHWADLVHAEADARGRHFPVTEMLDSHDVTKPIHERTIDDRSGRFEYVDISQNSWKRGDTNWANAQYVRDRLSGAPKPINSTKIYGSLGGVGPDGINGDDAVANFWRNLLGGLATSRFHRPESHGIGLCEKSAAQLRAARAWIGQFDTFRAQPDRDHQLLGDREPGEAYLSYIPGECWTLFFPDGGGIRLQTGVSGPKRIRWVDLASGEWRMSERLATSSASEITVDAPGSGPWLAVVEPAAASAFDYEAWKRAFFSLSEQSDPEISGPTASPNGDGIENRIKHQLGFRPYDRAEILRVFQGSAYASPRIEFQRNVEAGDFPAVIETASEIGGWSGERSRYRIEIVGIIEANDGLPARERVALSPTDASGEDDWFVRLRFQ